MYLLSSILLIQATSPLPDNTSSAQYCIVGAGPGGIQLGHFLGTKNRDYVTFEKSSTAGSFFREYPKQRQLISINKRFRGEKTTRDPSSRFLTESFAMRHDWNSLLGNATRPMTERTRELYPSADVLYQYLEDFAEHQNIIYETEVLWIQKTRTTTTPNATKITKITEATEATEAESTAVSSFNVMVKSWGGDVNTTTMWTCEHVVMANGLSIPNQPEFLGHEHMLDYVDLPQKGSWADGMRVLVMGFGNAGLEAAKSVQGWATETTVIGRPQPLPSPWREESPGDHGLRFSYHTHYVGDMRQINLNILDMYQLKSLDGFDYIPVESHQYRMMNCSFGFFQNSNNLLYKYENFPCISNSDTNDWTQEVARQEKFKRSLDGIQEDTDGKTIYECPPGFTRYVEVFSEVIDRAAIESLAQSVAKELGVRRKQWTLSGAGLLLREELAEGEVDDLADKIWKKNEKISRYAAGGNHKQYNVFAPVQALLANKKIVDLIGEFAKTYAGADPQRYGFHKVIRAFGWDSDKRISELLEPAWHEHGKLKKYPITDSVFQSTNVRHLWYAGALAHGRDYRIAAGGFIHGFRYNARVTFNAMEWDSHDIHWPYTKIPIHQGTTASRPNIRNREAMSNAVYKEDVDVDNLANWLEFRANNGDGTYQMFGQLVDACVILLQTSGSKTTHIRCMEEIPNEYLLERYPNNARVTLQFVYGKNHHGPKVRPDHNTNNSVEKLLALLFDCLSAIFDHVSSSCFLFYFFAIKKIGV